MGYNSNNVDKWQSNITAVVMKQKPILLIIISYFFRKNWFWYSLLAIRCNHAWHTQFYFFSLRFFTLSFFCRRLFRWMFFVVTCVNWISILEITKQILWKWLIKYWQFLMVRYFSFSLIHIDNLSPFIIGENKIHRVTKWANFQFVIFIIFRQKSFGFSNEILY